MEYVTLLLIESGKITNITMTPNTSLISYRYIYSITLLLEKKLTLEGEEFCSKVGKDSLLSLESLIVKTSDENES